MLEYIWANSLIIIFSYTVRLWCNIALASLSKIYNWPPDTSSLFSIEEHKRS